MQVTGNAFEVLVQNNVDLATFSKALDDLLRNWDRATDEMKRSFNKRLGGEVEQIIRTKYVVDDSGVKRLQVIEEQRYTALQDILKEYQKENKVQQLSYTNLTQSLKTLIQKRNETAKYVFSLNEAGKATRTISDEWKKANQEVVRAKGLLNELSGASFFDKIGKAFEESKISGFLRGLQNLVGGFQAVGIILGQIDAAVNTLISSGKQVQGLSLTFKSIGQGADGGAKALAEAARISQSLGVSLNSTINGFQQLTPVILASGGSMKDVSAITEALSSRFVAFGKSADESKRIMNAVIQAFGKGKLMSEELNQQIAEADPAFRTDLASAIGVSTQKLGEMIKNGEVTSQMLLKIIPQLSKTSSIFDLTGKSASDAARALNGELGPTLAQVEERIKTTNQLTLIDLSGKFEVLIKAVLLVRAAFADFFSELSKTGTLDALASILGNLVLGFANITIVILKVITLFAQILGPIGSAIKAILDFNVAGIKLGEILGTIAAISIVAFFIKETAAKIKSIIQTKAMVAELIKEVAAWAADTTGIGLNTAALEANALARKSIPAVPPPAPPMPPPTQSGLPALPPAGTTSNYAKELDQVSKSAANAADKVDDVASAMNTGAGAARSGAVAAGEAAKGAAEMSKAHMAGRAAVDLLANAVKGTGKFMIDLAVKARAVATALGPWPVIIGGLILILDKYIKQNGDANRELDRSKKSHESVVNAGLAMSRALKENGDTITKNAQATSQANAQWQGATDRVGGLWAGVDRLTRYFGLGTTELASYSNQLKAAKQNQNQFANDMNYATANFSSLITQNIEHNKVSQASIKGYKDLSTAIQQKISEDQKELAALKGRVAGGQAEQVTLDALRGSYQASIAQNQTRLTQLQQLAAQGNINIGVLSNETDKINEQTLALLKQQAAMAKMDYQQTQERLQPLIDKTKELYDIEKQKIEETKIAIDRKYETIERGIESAKRSEDARHTAATRAIEDEKVASQARWDQEMRNIEAAERALKKAYQAQVDPLKAKSPAELELARMQKEDLQKQASSAATYKERLEAQAQLERMARDEKINQLEKQYAAEQEALAETKRQKEAQRDAENAARDAKAREEERLHADTMKALDDQAYQAKIAKENELNGVKDQERKIDKAYKTEIDKMEKEINEKRKLAESLQRKVEWAEKDTKGKIDEATKAQGEHTKAINTSADAIRLNLNKQVDIYAEKIRNLPKFPVPPAGKFAGGPVSGGERAIVNELGKEAFLSSSGRLSWINKPAWGQWLAPSSGTVIPAHIAAGLDIPSGGIKINSSTTGAVSRSASGGNINYRMMARALSAVANQSNGTINNSVVINSDKPVKAASDMLVELTKLRRNRYY